MPALRVLAACLSLVCAVAEATQSAMPVKFYSVGLYLAPGAPLDSALDPSAPSALKLRVLDARHFPSHIPAKWRRALEASLPGPAMVRVRAAYRGLHDGEELTLSYVPGGGVSLRIGGRPIAHVRGHGLIERMLDIWAGNDPVTGKLHRIALEHPC